MAEKKKAFSLAEAMRDTIGSASTTNMASGGHFIDVNNASDEEITARILQLKIDAGNAILEIGRWLMMMKARKAHGEWAAWLAEQVDFSERIAQQYMQLYQGFSSNPNALSDLGKTKALKLLSLPPKERAEFMEMHNVEDMSVRELQKAIRERDEAKAAAEYSEKKLDELSRAFDESQTALEDEKARTLELNTKIKELEARPIDVAVQVDEDAIKKAADEARAAAEAEMQKKVDALKSKLKKAEEKAELAGAESNAEATKAKAEADRLRAELEAAKREQTKTANGVDLIDVKVSCGLNNLSFGQ